MSSKFKKVLIIASVFVVLGVIAVPISNNYIKNKIQSALKNLPDHINVSVEDISVNVLSGTVLLKDIDVSVLGKITNAVNVQMNLEDILVKHISYKDLIFNDIISISKVELNKPDIAYNHNSIVEKSAYVKTDSTVAKQDIIIEAFKINDGTFKMLNTASDSLMIHLERFDLQLNEIKNKKNRTFNIPVSFSNYELQADSIFVNAGKYENLNLGSIHLKKESLKISALVFETKYSRNELSKRIETERDHISLKIDSVSLNELDFGYKKDSIFSFSSDTISIFSPKFVDFRDKLVADNTKRKPMYSEMLRNLNFDLTLKRINIIDGEVVYEEKVNHKITPGKIFFTAYNANMENVSNTYNAGEAKTKIFTETKFMGDAPLKTEWEFDINDVEGTFIYKAELGLFHAEKINQFMEPNLNIDIKGILHKTYFTIDGNANTSSIDYKSNFEGLTVTVLRKDSKKKNKVLSALANLLFFKNSDKGENNYVEAKKVGIERDKTKSVFNFIWLNVKAGLLNVKQ